MWWLLLVRSPGKSTDANKPPSDTPQSQVHRRFSLLTNPPGLQSQPGQALVHQHPPWGLASSASPQEAREAPRSPQEPFLIQQCRLVSVTGAKVWF